MTVIYIDILLALNLFIDFLLLSGTARVLQRPTSRVRLILGALVGAASSLLILLPPLPLWLSGAIKLAVAALMVLVAFRRSGLRSYLKETAVLFVISAIFAGICSGLWYFSAPSGLLVQSGIVYYDVPPLLLIALTSLSYAVLCLYDRLTRKRIASKRCYTVNIQDGIHRYRLRAMPDSGHSLRDSFSGAAVILVKANAVKELEAAYSLATVGAEHAGRIRYIPFQSIGGEGVLAAFRPQCVTLLADGRSLDVTGVWIAPTPMLSRDEYDALIGPALTDLFS